VSLRERKQQRAREQIVEAAYALFAERGFAQVTVTDIAERAEVGRTTFFRYFGDKQEVVFADEQQVLAALAAVPPGAPRPASLREALAQLWELTASLGGLIVGDPAHYAAHERLIAANPELGDRMGRKLQRIADALEGVLLARGTEPEVAVQAAQLAIGCFRAAHRVAGEDPAELMPAMRRAVDRLLRV
jgi:AcrR family transcriptional regulator